MRLNRRRLLGISFGGLLSVAAASPENHALWGSAMIGKQPQDPRARQADRQDADHQGGRLSARPAVPTEAAPTGLRALEFGGDRDGLLFVPASYRQEQPAPLVVMFHGAGGNARGGLAPLVDLAEGAGFILLAVESRQKSWDLIVSDYGLDVAFVDRALAHVFARYAVDPARIAAEGFSDGASYALSLGITNGDLFTHVLAFSPGFVAPAAQPGRPRLFISHGTQDTVLPIDRCSRRIVPVVQRAGYEVLYREFEGGHTVPPEMVQEAVGWFTAP